LRLHWHPFSLYPRRVRIALREKRLACEEVVVDVPGGALQTAAFRTLNPFGQVPVLEDDGLVLYESIAILEYLEERYPTPALLPAGDPVARARTRQLMLASGDYLGPPFKRWAARFFTPETAWDRADQARAAEEIAAHLDVLEAELGDGRTYLTGAFSLADVCYAIFVCELETAELGRLLAARPRLGAWVGRLHARTSVQATRFAGAG
jgi:glutathione S-transferase